MKLAALILFCGLGIVPAHASPVLGIWQYDGFIFEGHRYPNPNPELFLTFTFTDKASRLFWFRKSESGSCERIADFQVTENYLHQKVIWVNPKNSPDCANDPDMRMGSETDVKFRVNDGYLELYFDINGQEFIYLLKNTGCAFD